MAMLGIADWLRRCVSGWEGIATFCCGIWLGNWKAGWPMLAPMGCKGVKLFAGMGWPGGIMPMLTYCWWVAWICCCCCCSSSICCWIANCSTARHVVSV